MNHEKELVVAYILWFLLGILGAHKFYLRRPLMGVLYFFTGGLCLIGWFIDLFTLPDQVSDFNDEIYLEDDREYYQEKIEELEDEVDYLRSQLRNVS